MKKLMVIIGAGVMMASLSGCLMFDNKDIAGTLVMGHVGPTTQNIDNSVTPAKCGTAKATGIIGITEGDASISAAMKAGGIKKVHHVDYRVKSILGIVGEYETIVWGE